MNEEKYRPVKGDRVRVVLEGEVHHADHLGVTLNWETGSSYASAKSTVSIEKLEPPVEVFGPGTVVRSKRSGWAYTVGEGGFLSHELGRWVIHRRPNHFTSKRYERVELQ